MLELTKTPRTDGMVEIWAVVPRDRSDAVAQAITEAAGKNVPADDLFPSSTPGSVLRGTRGLMDMTQAQLAAAVGTHVGNISAMERGTRPIGKDMAKRLAEALHVNYKVFL